MYKKGNLANAAARRDKVATLAPNQIGKVKRDPGKEARLRRQVADNRFQHAKFTCTIQTQVGALIENLAHKCRVIEEVVNPTVDDQAVCIAVALRVTGTGGVKVEFRPCTLADRVLDRVGVYGDALAFSASAHVGTNLK